MFSVIFDMDGTLLDTQRPWIEAWNWAGENQGYSNMGRFIPDVCGMNEKGVRAFAKEKTPEIDIEKFRADARQYMHENLAVRFKDGAKELLYYLKQRGVKIGLATGTTRGSTEHHLKEVGALELFDTIVCGNEVENGKPAPDIFLEAARKMGVNPKDCFVFEDSQNGVIAAHKAGMKCIGVADITPFNSETKALMYCELDNMDQATEIFENLE